MLTSNQRDVLAGVLTAIYMLDIKDNYVKYYDYIAMYEYYREKLNEHCEEKNETDH